MEKLKGKQERDGQELQEAMRKYGAHTGTLASSSLPLL